MSRILFVVSIPTADEEQKNHKEMCTKDKGNDNLAFEECSRDDNHKMVFSMEQILSKILTDVDVCNPIWITDENKKFKQVSFFVSSGEDYQTVLSALAENGIGAQKNTCVSILPCSLFYQQDGTVHSPKGKNILSSNHRNDVSQDTAWDRFVQSVQPRIIVSQVLENVQLKATLTFDYLVLLLIAGLTAALGLVEDSTVILVASMLISPMMGPVIAGMFGTVIPDKKLQKIGVFNGLLSLMMCVVIGFLFGVCVDLLGSHEQDVWPTNEMTTRGELRSLWVGTMIGVLSGAAIALAILNDNTESVIGVAISAALLPPAVNAGLFWAMALVNELFYRCESFKVHEYVWSKHPTTEFLTLGALSLCLTLLNIVFIFITGIIILKVKDVAPKQKPTSWNPIQLAREYKPLSDKEAHHFSEKLGENITRDDIPITVLNRQKYNVLNEINRPRLHTWSPGMGHFKRSSLKDLTVKLSDSNLQESSVVLDHNDTNEQRPKTTIKEFLSVHNLGEINQSRFAACPTTSHVQ